MTDEEAGRGRKGGGRRRGSSNLGDLVKAAGSGSKSPDERHLEAPQPWPKRPGPLNTDYRERGGSESSKTLDVRKLRPFVCPQASRNSQDMEDVEVKSGLWWPFRVLFQRVLRPASEQRKIRCYSSRQSRFG